MAQKPTIAELDRMAEQSDVTYYINRWYGGRNVSHEDGIELKRIQIKGYRGTSCRWLNSMLPEKMYRKPGRGDSLRIIKDGRVQLGNYTLGQRLTAATHWAQKAGIEIAVLARELGLEHLLGVEPDPSR